MVLWQAVALWNVSPRGTRAVQPEYTVENAAMLGCWLSCPSFLRRQQGLELLPLPMSQIPSTTIVLNCCFGHAQQFPITLLFPHKPVRRHAPGHLKKKEGNGERRGFAVVGLRFSPSLAAELSTQSALRCYRTCHPTH